MKIKILIKKNTDKSYRGYQSRLKGSFNLIKGIEVIVLPADRGYDFDEIVSYAID